MFYSATFIQHQRLLVTLQMILNNDVVMFSYTRINQLIITYTMINSDLHSCNMTCAFIVLLIGMVSHFCPEASFSQNTTIKDISSVGS